MILSPDQVQDMLLLLNPGSGGVTIANQRSQHSIDIWESEDTEYHDDTAKNSLSGVSSCNITIANRGDGCDTPIEGGPIEIVLMELHECIRMNPSSFVIRTCECSNEYPNTGDSMDWNKKDQNKETQSLDSLANFHVIRRLFILLDDLHDFKHSNNFAQFSHPDDPNHSIDATQLW